MKGFKHRDDGTTSRPASGEEKAIFPPTSRTIEINTPENFTTMLAGGILSTSDGGPPMQERFRVLVEAADQARSKLFLVSLSQCPWCVVAPTEQIIEQHRDMLVALDGLQRRIVPDTLWGMCVYAHEYALKSGLSDGTVAAGRNLGGPSVYPIRGIHELGFIDCCTTQTSIYFDLTAKPYIFTPESGKASDALCSGIIAIDKLGSTEVIQTLYSVEWRRTRGQGYLRDLRDYEEMFGIHDK